MRILNVVTQKGGTAKSETVKNLAYGLSQKGLRTLVIDLDPQANTSSTLLKSNKIVDDNALEAMKNEYDKMEKNGLTGMEGIEIIKKYMRKNIRECDISDVLLHPKDINDAIIKTDYSNLFIIPASSKLIEADMKLKASTMRVDTRLSLALEHIEKDYDVCIIDNSPVINSITINGITACKSEGDLVIVPIRIENGSLEGVDTTLQKMIEVLEFSSYLAFDFKLLFTMRNRNKCEKNIEETLRYLFPERCFEQTIRYQAKPIVQASLQKQILIESSTSNVSKDYRKLVEEIYNTI